jgi:phosphohistidine phosphatase SixA
MRYLTIVRHAHALPALPGSGDFERVLSEDGLLQCAQLRKWASDRDELGKFGPVTALISNAQRTKETFERAFAGTSFSKVTHYSDLIYNGKREVSGEDLLIDLAAIDPIDTSLLVVAHNPTVYEFLTQLASALPGELFNDGYPLGGAFVLALPEDEQIGLKEYELVASFVPALARTPSIRNPKRRVR